MIICVDFKCGNRFTSKNKKSLNLISTTKCARLAGGKFSRKTFSTTYRLSSMSIFSLSTLRVNNARFFSCLCLSYSSSREILRVGWEVKKPGFLCARLLIVRGDCVKSSPPSYFLPPRPTPPLPGLPKIKNYCGAGTLNPAGKLG